MIRTKSSNPTFREDLYENLGLETYHGATMTVGGTAAKIGALFALFLASAVAGWQMPNMGLLIGTAIGAFIVALVTVFKKEWAAVTGPLYAVLKGFFVGGISVLFASAYNGIVPQAALITVGVFVVMYTLWATNVIKVTETFKMAIVGATLGIAATYLLTLLIGMFAPSIYQLPIYQASPIGIGFSILVLIIAAMNLALDFQFVREGVDHGAPKYLEWYAAFGLMVTIVWIYIEALNLLRKIAGNR